MNMEKLIKYQKMKIILKKVTYTILDKVNNSYYIYIESKIKNEFSNEPSIKKITINNLKKKIQQEPDENNKILYKKAIQLFSNFKKEEFKKKQKNLTNKFISNKYENFSINEYYEIPNDIIINKMPNEAKKKLDLIKKKYIMDEHIRLGRDRPIDIPKNYIIILEENNDYSYICLIIGIINYNKIFKIDKSQTDNLKSFKITDSIKKPLFYYKLLEEYKLKDEMKINLKSISPNIDSTFYKLINNKNRSIEI